MFYLCFSSNLEKEPEIQITGLEVAIRISGYDDEEQFSEVLLKFQSVLEFTRTSSKFGITEGSYDTVIKIENSKRLAELKENKLKGTMRFGLLIIMLFT